jgi:hypothetical protein
LLGARGDFSSDADCIPWRKIVVLLVLCGGLHGMAMGSHSGNFLQLLLSAIKIPFLIAISTGICIPSLFAMATISGLRDDFPAVIRAVLASQATVAVTLCCLSPLLFLLYASTDDYTFTKLFNAFLFLVASLAGQITLQKHYRDLVRRDPRHVHGRRLWWFLYVLVTIQLAWVLRPFIGNPNMTPQLFRADAWGNAYVEMLRTVLQLWRS